ncbi:hypothetical protein Tco_1050702, partial [Tanacetum coccineum]
MKSGFLDSGGGGKKKKKKKDGSSEANMFSGIAFLSLSELASKKVITYDVTTGVGAFGGDKNVTNADIESIVKVTPSSLNEVAGSNQLSSLNIEEVDSHVAVDAAILTVNPTTTSSIPIACHSAKPDTSSADLNKVTGSATAS